MLRLVRWFLGVRSAVIALLVLGLMSAVVLADDPDGNDSDDDNGDDGFYDVSDDEIHWAMEEDADPFDDPWDFDDD